MTVETATNFTISQTVDQTILAELEATFDGYRSRIANLSVEACGTLTSMFTPLGPIDTQVLEAQVINTHVLEAQVIEAQVIEAQVIDTRIIDIEAIEWDQFAVELVAPTLQSITA